MNWFKKEEFACPCCHQNHIDDVIMTKIDKVRDKLGVPLHVNSGFRCSVHNRDVGGKTSSLHTFGKAVDISTATLTGEKKRLLLALAAEEFNGIGIAKTFYHFDIGDKKLWVY